MYRIGGWDIYREGRYWIAGHWLARAAKIKERWRFLSYETASNFCKDSRINDLPKHKR